MPIPWLTHWREERILRRERIDAEIFRRVLREMRSTAHLRHDERRVLRDLATLFLHYKSIEPAGGIELTHRMRVRIACEACVPILKLGIELYASWHTVVVYPGEFVVPRAIEDEAGVVHEGREVLSGEAWDRGPVIVSWADIADAVPGENVMIHEVTHKLDLLDGAANGCPPLHRGVDPKRWRAVFTDAFSEHSEAVEADDGDGLDPYAAEDPAEFFAVSSEAFFETPLLLQRDFPDVYRLLASYYRQETLPGGSGTHAG